MKVGVCRAFLSQITFTLLNCLVSSYFMVTIHQRTWSADHILQDYWSFWESTSVEDKADPSCSLSSSQFKAKLLLRFFLWCTGLLCSFRVHMFYPYISLSLYLQFISIVLWNFTFQIIDWKQVLKNVVALSKTTLTAKISFLFLNMPGPPKGQVIEG